jgi:predicted tellurium resistance membrane protein TerC
MIIMALLLVGSMGLLFFAPVRGLGGAIILGIDAVGVDLLWQWLRIRLLKNTRTSWLLLGIFGGMVIRAISIFLFLKLAAYWLGFQTFNFLIFAIFLLTIPIWSLIGSGKFKTEKEN